ncbi:MAG TPA: thioesterase family protein [Burkholderiaceae bacterium]|nr:thioesterase family protein [Burkholderiaceae bacterium]
MTFIKQYMIRLSHCDATGQVFYPNYFHIFNALVEDWFYEGIEIPFDRFLMEQRLSLPTVRLETTFLKPSRMGEMVDFWLTVTHVGRSSVRFTMGVDKDGEQRVRMNRVAVCTSQDGGGAVELPADLREKILAFMRA